MLNSILTIGKRISNFKSEETISEKIFIKRIFAIVSFSSIVLTLSMLGVSIVFDFHYIYFLLCSLIPILFFVVLLLDTFQHTKWAKFYGTVVLPIWLNITVLLGGGGFSESTAMAAFLVFTYVSHDKESKLERIIIGFNLFFHIVILAYVSYCSPLIEGLEYPFDEVIVFSLSIGWIFFFLKKIEYEKNKLIHKLQEKNEKLIETKEELERFTYIASHDLKSPLQNILTFAELTNRHLEKGEYDKLKASLHFINSNANQMNYLINDVLEFSQISNKTDSEQKQLELREIMKKVKTNLEQEITTKNAKLLIGKLPSYFGNETELILLFQNIIQNGIKYNTSSIPTVQVWAEPTSTQLKIEIKDNGIGIAANHHEQVFQFFKRLHTKSEYQGTGLGLGLCRKIVQKYGGTISLVSDLGKGANFTIILPI